MTPISSLRPIRPTLIVIANAKLPKLRTPMTSKRKNSGIIPGRTYQLNQPEIAPAAAPTKNDLINSKNPPFNLKALPTDRSKVTDLAALLEIKDFYEFAL